MKKVLFSINITNDKANEVGDEIYFVTSTIDASQESNIEHMQTVAKEQESKSSLPMPLAITKVLSFFLWIILLGGLLNALADDTTIEEAFNNAPFIFFLLPITFVSWSILYYYEKYRKKNVAKSPEFEQLVQTVESVVQSSKMNLGIPDDANMIDVLGFRYKINEDDTMKVMKTGLVQYVNLQKYIYRQEDSLCFGDMEQVITIPLHYIKTIEQINKKIALPQWNKEISFNKEEYKKYKIKANNMGMLFIKPYYVAHIETENQLFDLYIPSYEIEPFLQLTGLQIETSLESDIQEVL